MGLRSLPRRLVRAALRRFPPGASPLHGVEPPRLRDFIKFPCYPPPASRLEQRMIRAKAGRMTCTVCGFLTAFRIEHDNLRETCICATCGATNRHRQVAYVLCATLSRVREKPIVSLSEIESAWPDVAIYNTEARGPVHARLSALPGYQASEYFGPTLEGGQHVGEVMHQNLQKLSFSNHCFDVVLSSDVFEHIPDPYTAHAEVHRVLKRGGRHVFTVPFHGEGHLDEIRARPAESGIEYLAPPIYHHDPQTGKNDVLVYTIFGLEMLVRLRRIGFQTTMYQLSAPRQGILGGNALVFEATPI